MCEWHLVCRVWSAGEHAEIFLMVSVYKTQSFGDSLELETSSAFYKNVALDQWPSTFIMPWAKQMSMRLGTHGRSCPLPGPNLSIHSPTLLCCLSTVHYNQVFFLERTRSLAQGKAVLAQLQRD